ncbi:MAG: sensor histidine kinase [Candidatus Dormibacteria bacterium]
MSSRDHKLRILPATLRWRLTSLFLALLLAALAVVGTFQYFALRSILFSQLAGNLQAQAHTAIGSQGRVHAISDPRALVGSASSPGIEVGLYDGQGNPVVPVKQGPGSEAWVKPPISLLQRRPPPMGPEYQVLDSPGGQVLAVAVPVGPRDSTTALVMESSLKDTLAILRGDLLIFSAAALGALAVGAALSPLLTGRVLRRLKFVSTAAKSISAGDYDHRSAVAGDDEVGILGSAFDEMVARLQDEIDRQRNSEASMRRFLADVSHELRTPLTTLRGNLDVLLRGSARNPADLDRSLGDMHQTVIRMSSLAQDLLTLARLDQGEQLRLAPVEITGMLEQAARDGRHLARKHRIKLDVSQPLSARADPDATHRVLLNLIDNAGKYSPAGASIILRAQADGADLVRVDVVDQGPGIPASEKDKIFERFYRGEGSDKPGRAPGFGLGLSICAMVMERQNGMISVESEAGAGSTFRLTLPRVTATGEPG